MPMPLKLVYHKNESNVAAMSTVEGVGLNRAAKGTTLPAIPLIALVSKLRTGAAYEAQGACTALQSGHRGRRKVSEEYYPPVVSQQRPTSGQSKEI